MQIISFTHDDQTRVGILRDGAVVDVARVNPDLPGDLKSILREGRLEELREIAMADAHFSLADVRLESPIKRPGKILAIGLNYRAHAEESGMDIPKYPVVFTKQNTSINGPYDPVHRADDMRLLDYEGELAIVIGKRARRVPKDKAAGVIAGFAVNNDVSVRDWQMRSTPPQFTMGKSWDTHCPLGPALVTPDEVDPHGLRLRTWVNDELRQDSNTSDLIFDCYDIIAYLSTAFTLEPGDVIVTGTPSGVGAAMQPPQGLVVGDRVKVEIEGLGHIVNEIIDEPASATTY
ncbi:MAG: fumarylacetoacetate hydrolase family protein [Pseudomonadota bacterium]